MPIIIEQTCSICGKLFMGVTAVGVFSRGLCSKCYLRRVKNNKRKWLNQRRVGKTLKQRINWIEEFIYENKDKIDREKEEIKYA